MDNINNVKIERIKATNFKGFEKIEISIPPGEDKIIFTGDNRAGKTSIFEIVQWVLGGRGMISDKTIHDGESEMTGEIKFDKFTISRRHRIGKPATGKDLKIAFPGGMTIEGARKSFIESLTNEMLNPTKFISMSPAEQLKYVMKVKNVSLSSLEAEETAAYTDRTLLGRQIDRMGDIPEIEKVKHVDIEGLRKEKDAITKAIESTMVAAQKANQEFDDREKHKEDIARECKSKKVEIDRIKKNIDSVDINLDIEIGNFNAAKKMISSNLECGIKRLKDEIDRIEREADTATKDIDEQIEIRRTKHEQEKARNEIEIVELQRKVVDIENKIVKANNLPELKRHLMIKVKDEWFNGEGYIPSEIKNLLNYHPGERKISIIGEPVDERFIFPGNWIICDGERIGTTGTYEVNQAIIEAEKQNMLHEQWKKNEEKISEKSKLQSLRNGLDAKISEIRRKKIEKLTSMNLGVPGLVAQEDGLYLDGVFAGNLSGAQRYEVALGLYIAEQPKLKAVFLDGGEAIGPEIMEKIELFAKSHGIRLLVTIRRDRGPVPNQPGDNVFYIEDGRVTSSPDSRAME